MTPELIQIAEGIESIGFPTFFITVAFYIILKLVNVGFHDHAAAQERNAENFRELLRLRAEHSSLERKFTECREALRISQGGFALSDHIKQDAIQELLDDTVSLTDIIRGLKEDLAAVTLERDKCQALLK